MKFSADPLSLFSDIIKSPEKIDTYISLNASI